MRRRTKRPVCAVVKADAYGHGQAVVEAMAAADGFAVATYAEALRLKRITDKPVLILGPAENAPVPAGAVPSVGSFAEADLLARNGWRGRVHIKVDTGMRRLGCRPESARLLADRIAAAGMRPDGVFTHFHCAEDAGIAARQFALFDDATRGLGLQRHCCASNGLFLPEAFRLNMTRPGLALYGYGAEGLMPAMRVTGEVTALHFVKRGEYIGYGRIAAPRDMTAATIRGGYADGFRRGSLRRTVQIRGKACPVVGQVCMDMFFADVTDILCHVGDEVVVLGDGEALARAYGTIVYEVLTGFGQARGQRRYVY